MHVRLLTIAAAGLMSTSAFAAQQPAKPQLRPAVEPQPAAAQVILASADDSRTVSAADQQVQATPKKPVRGRVTTCRCGDEPAQPER